MADSDVTALLATPELDREELMGQLVPLVYDELRRMAHRQLAREAGPRTLNTTGLVHEAYLKLIDEKTVPIRNRRYFFGAAARAMIVTRVSGFVGQRCAPALRRGRQLLLCTVAILSPILLAGRADSHVPAPEAHDHSIRIVATDDGYQFPDRVPAGMSHVVFENHDSTIHEAMFIKLPDGMAGDDYLEAVRNGISFPEGAIDYAGPGLTSPGETVEIWLDLDPGDYLLGCWFRGHLTSLPPQILRVNEAGSAGATPPREDAILRLIDFRFELEGELSQGARVLRVETPGPSMHEVDIFRLEDGQTLDDLRQWQKRGKKGTPPAVAIGGVLDSHDLSRVVWLRTDFRPGRHVLWCNMPIVPDVPGPTHADSGMFTEFVIE